MGYTDDITESNVEDRIVGEFMHRLQDAEVSFEMVELMEEQSSKNDFGGAEELIDRIKAELIHDGD